jgi:hypothetical protein
MNVQLIVVQGRPEGKKIPLLGPRFKIGRGETCHLRPNSELVSREHAEFQIEADRVIVRDLGSRNGTLVNGKALTEPFVLKNGDLVQVGPLTFAVAIQGAPAKAAAGPAKVASLDEPSHDQIESWLIADNTNPTPERPSGVYGGDTLTIKAFKEATAPPPDTPTAAADEASDDESYERLSQDEDIEQFKPDEESAAVDEMPEEFMDESNPFYAAKKAQAQAQAQEKANKPAYQDTSDAAQAILKRMMERRRASKSS